MLWIDRWRRRAALSCLSVALGLQPLMLAHAQAQRSAPAPRLPADTPSLPQLGDGQTMSLGEERRLGDLMARAIYRDPAYLDDPVLGDYLLSLWQPLVRAAQARGEVPPEMAERFAWQLMLSRDRSVNAFAMPGGYLGVHLGLIATTQTADELASVLAHELVHVSQRHIARLMERQNQQAPLMLAGLLLGILAASAAKNADIGSAAIMGTQAMGVQDQLNFSRDMEREADRVGFGVLSDAGFDGQGFVGMFERLQQSARLNDDGGFPYLRSHPLTTERMADMRARLPLVAPSQTPGATPPGYGPAHHGHDHPGADKRPPPLADAPWRHALMAARAKVLAESGADRQRARPADTRAPGPAQPGGPLLQGPGSAARWYETALLATQQRDWPAALGAADALLQRTQLPASVRPTVDALVVEVLLAAPAGSLVQGADLASWAARLAAHDSRAARWLQARAARQTGDAAAQRAARERLQAWVTEHPRDALAWQALAALHQADGQALRAVRAEAEAQWALLDHAGARDRFKSAQNLARRLPSQQVDPFDLAIIDARTREVERLQQEWERDALAQRRR